MNAKKRIQLAALLMFLIWFLAGCSGSFVEPNATAASPSSTAVAPTSPDASLTPVLIETYQMGEPVVIQINDTIEECEDHLLYAIVQVTESEDRDVALAHSCLGYVGSGVDWFCRDGQAVSEVVVTCSDVMQCEETQVTETYTWDQQEFVQISEECAGETIYREIQQQAPAGTYRVIVRYFEGEQIKTGVIKEFIIASGTAPETIMSTSGTNVVAGTYLPDSHKMAFDSDGILHLVWRDGRGLMHSQLMPGRTWSRPQELAGNFETFYSLVDLIRNPAGHVCVFFDAAAVSAKPSTAGLYMRCLEGGRWTPAGDRVPGDYAPTFAPSISFAPDGSVRLLHATGPGNAPVKLDGQPLSPDQGVIFDLALAISPTGNYHALWQRQSEGRALEYRFSQDGGATWTEVEKLGGIPLLSALSLLVDDQDNAHLVGWAGEAGVYYLRPVTGGGWESAVLVSGELPGGAQGHFSLGPDGLAHIVWENEFTGGRHYVQQLADGTWSQPVLISKETAENIRFVIDAGDVLHFVWQGGDAGLYYASVP